MRERFGDEFVASPYMNSYDTTPDREGEKLQQQHSSCLSEPASLWHSPSSSSLSEGSSSFKTSDSSSWKGVNKKYIFGERKSASFAYRIREHVKLGPKLSETVKGKLSLGKKIIQQGGRGNIFKQIFGVNQGEELLKASQCYLSTTAGPISGLLFISTEKLAFCSERSITVPSATNNSQLIRTPYKVVIPITKIKTASQSENVNKPQQKYIEIVTDDDFEFWFMGFLRYEKAFRNLQKAISMSMSNQD
ncbi:hypothetical protein M0R45_022915 [Rubus argutus]|uniref:GRAM domain-containing protein n=1 Tax=Rubus argutus TaxID=59490 RepID=A0AAW1WLE1_RUBAR